MALSTRHTPTTSAIETARPVLVLVLSMLAMVTALLQTMVVPVLHQIGDALNVSASAVGWAVTVNLLAAAVFTPILSKVGDIHGRRRVLIGILVTVAAGSLLAAVTSSLAMLLIARAMQGVSFGLFPLSIGILRASLPAHRLSSSMAIVSGAIGVGGGVGLVLTGLVLRDGGDYRRMFWLALVVALVLVVCALGTVPADDPHRHGRVDWIGGLLLGLSLVLLLLPLSQGHEWGWRSTATIGSFAGSVATFVLWGIVERHVREPLVPLEMLRNRALMATHAAGMFIGFGMFTTFLVISAFVQVPRELGYGFSASVLQTSCIYLVPAATIGIITAPLGGYLLERLSGRTTLIIASTLGLVGFAQMAVLHSQSWHLILGGVITNGAFSMGYAALPALVVAEVRPEETAIANGVNSIARSIGSALGSALVITLLSSRILANGHSPESSFITVFIVGSIAMLTSILIVVLGMRPSTNGTDPRSAEEIEREHALSLGAEWAIFTEDRPS
ncbi:MFS transporter [Aeromicrobium sp. A1-2]|uniref:MFS transporter n=1 Tax=Aeromicrobium sp. A1-2 TaxID=2107713 RepID=UPI000E52101B|nr:MFS transporter [Aeromicrobium sp. A1-2]AXT84378.1 MFS transporter [Aeromicrobium sp. A1-2]